MRIYYSMDQDSARLYFLGNFDSYRDAIKVAQTTYKRTPAGGYLAFHSGESHVLWR